MAKDPANHGEPLGNHWGTMGNHGGTMGNREESRWGDSFFVPDAALEDLGVTFYVLSMGFELSLSFTEIYEI